MRIFRPRLLVLLGVVMLWVFTKEQQPSAITPSPRPSDFRLYRQITVNAWSNAPVSKVSKFQGPAVPISGQWQQFANVMGKSWIAGARGGRRQELSTPFKTLEQQIAYDDLLTRHGAGAQLYLREGIKTPMQIKGFSYRHPAAVTPEEQATAFLNDYQHLLLTRNAQVEWKISHVEKDELGRTNLRFSQTYEGLEVFPAELSVHVDQGGTVDLLDGVFVPTPEIEDLQPTIQFEDALAKGVRAIPGGFKGQVANTRLVVHAPLDGEARLAWKFNVKVGLTQDWLIVVDAKNGELLKQINQCCSLNVLGSGMDLNNQVKPLNVLSEGGAYYLLDTTKLMANPSTGQGVIAVLSALNKTDDEVRDGAQTPLFGSLNPHSWGNPTAVSAAYNLSVVYDYFLNQHGRNSYNGKGSNLLAIVNVANYPNAHWAGDRMVFGDGDKYAASLDVVAHEISHGVTGSIGTNGVLMYFSQSGALNESFSDIFGELAELWRDGANDWILGTHLNQPVRNMKNPGLLGKPSKMSDYRFMPETKLGDNGGVHINSSIINRAFYLLAEGMPDAIGKPKAGQIFYRCLTQHMKPLSQFIDARLGCIVAAETLFGANSIEAIKTAEAFDSVELYADPVTARLPDSDLGSVAGPDSTVFVYDTNGNGAFALWRREALYGDPSAGVSLVSGLKSAKLSMTHGGTNVVFVSADHRLAIASTATGSGEYLTGPVVHSAAISPNAKFAAIVLRASGYPTNQILILDFEHQTVQTNVLETAGYDGVGLERVLFADSLDFSPDGKFLIYDAAVTRRNISGAIGVGVAVYALDLATQSQRLLMPAVEGLNFGNPSFSHTSGRFIAFEAQGSNGNAAVFTADIYEGVWGLHAITTQTAANPVFAPDDSALIYIDYDASSFSGKSMYRRNLAPGRLLATSGPTIWLRGPSLGTLYRRGAPTELNSLPTITVTSPSTGTVLDSPGITLITCNATDSDGSIERVELFIGSKVLVTNTVSPYTFTANGLPAGNHVIFLRAYDNLGASTTTPPLHLEVKPPAGKARFVQTGFKQFEMYLPVPASGAYRIESSTNLVDWISVGTVFTSSGILNFSDFRATNHVRQFYRGVKLD